jgi:hypothetical protein
MGSIIKVNEYKDFNNNAIMTSDGAGVVTPNASGIKNTPAFHARTSTDQNLTRSTAVLIVNFVEDFDVGSCFASNRFTVPSGEGGKYGVYFSLSCNTGAAGGDGELIKGDIYKNGAYLTGFRSILQDNGLSNMYISNYTATLTGVTTLSAADYLELYATTADQDASGTVQSNANTIFGAYRIIGA